MSKHPIAKFDLTVPAKFAERFGPPALLAAEDQQIHDGLLCGFFHDVRPRNFFEDMFINDLAYYVCLRQALRRLRYQLIRHANNQRDERLERELLSDAERRKEKLRSADALDKALESWRDRRQPQTQLAIEQEKRLADIDAETNRRLAELQKAKDGPIDEAASFEQWIDAVERIDKQLAVLEQNIRSTFKLLDEHRTGLGPRLRQDTDEIVDVEFAEESAPACEETVDRAQSACGTEVRKASTEPITVSSVAELPLPAPSPTSGSAPIESDGPQKSALPPGGGPAEQQ